MLCKGMSAYGKWMFAGIAYTGLSKNVGWNVTNADTVIFVCYHTCM
jgi:hypothetical protein